MDSMDSMFAQQFWGSLILNMSALSNWHSFHKLFSLNHTLSLYLSLSSRYLYDQSSQSNTIYSISNPLSFIFISYAFELEFPFILFSFTLISFYSSHIFDWHRFHCHHRLFNDRQRFWLIVKNARSHTHTYTHKERCVQIYSRPTSRRQFLPITILFSI